MYSAESPNGSEETANSQLGRIVTASWARYEILYRNPVLMGFLLFLIVCGVVMFAPMISYRFLYGDF